MTTSSLTNDSADRNITQAARHLAKAVATLRDQGDNEYAAIIQFALHSLERPYWITPNP